MKRYDFSNDDKNILLALGFKIETDSKGCEIALYDFGYQHYIQVRKTMAPPQFLTSRLFIEVSTINRDGYIVDKDYYDLQKLTKSIIIKIKNLILLLHKVELSRIIQNFDN